ncbi:hypothetical protein, conserved [Eimeria acervulina]|uniref:Uncharacterized protein n=1 Tax=Eimeria acervulina TaxID=5801 RepID=U6GDB2_EIMAC|nr:hypothetical protein, conserved [Eimeria acervulina]CDI77343.1 hypothetical protein, conserved [Eimeria acervulina]
MISSVCWVPRGRSSQSPRSCILEEQDMAELLQQQQQQQSSSSSSSSKKEQRKKQQQLLRQQAAAEDGESDEANSDHSMEEDEDEDEDEGLLNGVFGVLSSDGPAALTDKQARLSAADEAEDEAANKILATDLVLVAAAAEADFSTLEVAGVFLFV